MAIETSVKIKAVVEGLNNLKQIGRGVDSELKKVSKSFTNFGNKLTGIGKTASLALTGPIAALGVVGLKNFDKQAKAIAQVEAGLKSTGEAAGFTSTELQKLASGLQNNSLFGDEEILKDVTAQLLTFTNVAQEQFARTQAVALDLATRLDGDLKSATIQLGKALNDPAANLSALSRSGIQFSKDQVKVIKELQATNRLADAQTLILKELENQYGGSAAAAAAAGLGPFKQLQNSLGDLTEEFGAVIAEAIIPFVSSIRSLVDEFKTLGPETRRTIVIIAGLVAAIGPALIILGKMSVGLGVLIKAFSVLRPIILATSLTIKGALISTGIGALVVALGFAIAKIAEMRSQLGSFKVVFEIIGLQLKKFGQEIKLRFTQATNAVGNFFRRLTGRQEVKANTDAIAADIAALEDKIAFTTAEATKAAQEQSRDPANKIDINAGVDVNSILNDINAKAPVIKASAKPIEIPAKITLDQELATSNSILDGAEAANTGALLDAQLGGADIEAQNAIRLQGLRDYRDTLNLVLQDQLALAEAQNDPRVTDSIIKIKQAMVDTDATIKELTATTNTVPSAAMQAQTAFKSFADQAALGVQNLTSLGLNGITDAFASIVDGTKTASEAFKNFAQSVIKQLIKIGIQKAIVSAIGGVFNQGGSVGGGNNSSPSFFNTGGNVTGPGTGTSDSIPAWLSNGEYVIRTKAAHALGLPLLNALNKSGPKGLAKFMSGNMDKFRNKASRPHRGRALAFQDGGLVDGQNQGQQQRQSMPNLTINIENKSQARISAIQPEGPSIQDQVKGLVYSIILEDAAAGGPLTRAGGRA